VSLLQQQQVLRAFNYHFGCFFVIEVYVDAVSWPKFIEFRPFFLERYYDQSCTYVKP
jgi:hypothetical protein